MTVYVGREGDLPESQQRVGAGWATLVAFLNRDLWHLQPAARAGCRVGSDGLPIVMLYDPLRRSETRTMCDAIELELLRTCELCGGPGRLCAGCVVSVLCDACRSHR